MGKMTVPPQSARASGAAQMKRRLPAASSFTEVKVRSPMQKRQARTKENTPVVISVQCYGGRGDRWNDTFKPDLPEPGAAGGSAGLGHWRSTGGGLGRWCVARFRPQPLQNLGGSTVFSRPSKGSAVVLWGLPGAALGSESSYPPTLWRPRRGH